MSITLGDNISLPVGKPLRTTQVVGVATSTYGAPSTYPNKEAIPEYMRYLYMEIADDTGKRWVLRNLLDKYDWSPIPIPHIEPSIDGVWGIRKAGDNYTWEAVTAGGGGGGTWGSITGTLSAQTDLQTELDTKIGEDTTGTTSHADKIWVGTQAEYTALTPVATTVYFIL